MLAPKRTTDMSAQGAIEEIKKVKLYYQEFHHKCVGWYITIMGFFIAGSIAAGTPAGASKYAVGLSIIFFSLLISLLFFFCLFHYSKRIEVLNSYLLRPDTITNDWYTRSTNVFIAIHGVGSWFFLSVVVSMQAAVAWLTAIKYLC